MFTIILTKKISNPNHVTMYSTCEPSCRNII